MKFVSIAGLGLLVGCSQPTHMQYDFSRAYVDSILIQSDVDRSSAADSKFLLDGVDGIAIRQQAHLAATDSESGQASQASSKD